MSREFYSAIDSYHRDRAKAFAAGGDGVRRHVECRITDQIYVYLYEGDDHIQTQHVAIPEAWGDNWPSDATVRRHIRSQTDLGRARITTLEA